MFLISHFPLYSSVTRRAAYGDSVSDTRINTLLHNSVLGLESIQWAVGTCSEEINFPSVKPTVYFYFPISIFFYIVLKLWYIFNLYSARDYKTCIHCWAHLSPTLGLGCLCSLQGISWGYQCCGLKDAGGL